MEPDETKLGTSDIIDEQSELAVLMAASQYEATLNYEATLSDIAASPMSLPHCMWLIHKIWLPYNIGRNKTASFFVTLVIS